ncbi:MAG: hypothetical protein P4L81_03490 [Candidatus Pacebacteria bacterium]|nr:hypothetical protein [Candidatus Paceibacterota bacterium]
MTAWLLLLESRFTSEQRAQILPQPSHVPADLQTETEEFARPLMVPNSQEVLR